MYARSAIQGVHFDTGIISQGRQSRFHRREARFHEGVLFVARPGLRRELTDLHVIGAKQLHFGQRGPELSELAGVAAGEQQPQSFHAVTRAVWMRTRSSRALIALTP